MANELVKPNVDVVPSYLTNVDLSGPTGLEAITPADMKIARLAIAQKISDEVDEDKAKFIEGLKPGMFFNTLSKEIYGKGPLTITPLVAKLHRRYFSPRDAGSQTLCISNNGIDGGRIAPLCLTCPKSQWGFDNEKQKPIPELCTKFWSYMILLHNDNNIFVPMILSLKRKMIPQAEEFNTFMNQRRINGQKAKAYMGLYQISTFQDDTSAAGGFANIKFKNDGWISQGLLEEVKNMFDEYGPKIDEQVKMHADTDVDSEIIDDKDVPF